MSLRLRITSLTSSGGETVQLSPDGITCIVGGNNVGKSRILREIASNLLDPNQPGAVLSSLEVDKQPATLEEAQLFLTENSIESRPNSGAEQTYRSINGGPIYSGMAITAEAFLSCYNQQRGLGPALSFLGFHASAGSLLNQASGTVDRSVDAATHPLARLVRDGELEAQLSEICELAFGYP